MRQNGAESSDRDSRFRYRVCVIIERVQTATQRTEAAEGTMHWRANEDSETFPSVISTFFRPFGYGHLRFSSESPCTHFNENAASGELQTKVLPCTTASGTRVWGQDTHDCPGTALNGTGGSLSQLITYKSIMIINFV